MKVFLLVAGLVALTKAASIEKTGAAWRIVNGEDAKLGEIPFQVSLQTTYDLHYCGGSVVNQKFVITAAHCVDGKSPKEVIVVAGTIDLREPKLRKTVEKIIVHEKYDEWDSWKNDIALLKVQDEFVITATLDFVKLPNPHEFIPAESVATVSGWGRLSEEGPSPTVLQKAQIQITDHELCRKAYGRVAVYDTHICAHDPNAQKDSCSGDSGGPLMVNNKLVGIVSWGQSCASPTYPSVYTRVSEYIDWIESHVW